MALAVAQKRSQVFDLISPKNIVCFPLHLDSPILPSTPKVSKVAKIRNPYNQVPHLTQT